MLRLDHCYFTSTDDQYGSSLAALSALVGLQHLELVDDTDADGADSMPSAVLQHLPHLTYLRIYDRSNHTLSSNSLVHASCLTNLQELHIAGAGLAYQGVLLSLSPSTIPGLSRLTALRQVTLQAISLDPSILQDCTQLQGLELEWVSIISARGAVALHSLLGRLQQLQYLQLHELEYDWPGAAAVYTSLTASSALQKLHLSIEDMPADVWPHVFSPGRQLPALRELTLPWHDMDVLGRPLPAAALGTDDLSRIMQCCPGLCSISFPVRPGTQLADLVAASSLTSLWVSGLHEEGFESLSALSGLVSLQELDVRFAGPITPCDLLCLTALRHLTRLIVSPMIWPEMLPEFEGAYDEDAHVVDLDLIQGTCLGGQVNDTPVWLQLLQHCGRFSECQPWMFHSVAQQLAEQQQRHTQQEQQLAAQQQRIALLEEQLAATRAQAAAEAAAQVQGRLQALEGQVQQMLQAMQLQGGDVRLGGV